MQFDFSHSIVQAGAASGSVPLHWHNALHLFDAPSRIQLIGFDMFSVGNDSSMSKCRLYSKNCCISLRHYFHIKCTEIKSHISNNVCTRVFSNLVILKHAWHGYDTSSGYPFILSSFWGILHFLFSFLTFVGLSLYFAHYWTMGQDMVVK